MRKLCLVWMLGGALALGGCQGKGPSAAPLEPQKFYAAGNGAAAKALQPGGNGEGGDVAVASDEAVPAAGAPEAFAAAPEPDDVAIAAPASAPAPGVSSGQYLIVGTVVAEANGRPIYADKVLAEIDAALGIQAQQLGPQEFRMAAAQLIRAQIEHDINEELAYAAAVRGTTEEEKAIAAGATTQWRQRAINQAGGAVSVARARALEEGFDFEELAQREYRRNLIGIYRLRKLYPRVQVTAEEMRHYYERNLEGTFTEKAEVRFRAIRIGVRETGGRAAALEKIRQIREKAVRGDDFAELAALQNDDRSWARNRGYIAMVEKKDEAGEVLRSAKGEPVMEGVWMQAETLRLSELERAIFAVDVGEVTEIIDGGDAFYIAKLEEKKPGRLRAFEDPVVQEQIRRTLRSAQERALIAKEQKKLMAAAVVRMPSESQIGMAIEMAMQKYAAWASQ